jgi:hypothetical protein
VAQRPNQLIDRRRQRHLELPRLVASRVRRGSGCAAGVG